MDRRRLWEAEIAAAQLERTGTTAEFWLNGQRNWDLWHAIRSPEALDIEEIEPVAK